LRAPRRFAASHDLIALKRQNEPPPASTEQESGMSFFSGLLRGVGRLLDPNRLAMAQALVEGEPGIAADIVERFRQLQEEHERLRISQNRARRAGQRSRARLGRLGGETEIGPKAGITSNSLAEEFGQAIIGQARRTPPFREEERRQFEANMRLKGVNGHGYAGRNGDQDELAQAVFAEAVGSPEDMPAIASAMLNRVRPGGPPAPYRDEMQPTLREVLRSPSEFPFMPNEGGNGPAGSEQYQLYLHPERMTPEQRRARAIAQRVAALALAGKLEDPTGDATFYHSTHEYDGLPGTMPDPDFRRNLESGRFRQSRYRSPYPRRPGDTGSARTVRRPTYFFEDLEDFPEKD
jgi:hypothetical protein